MSNYPIFLKSLAWRLLFALPFFVIGVKGWVSFMSPFSILIGAVILGFPLAGLASEWFGEMLLSRDHDEPAPTPMYSIPQARKASGLYEEAMNGFEEIAREFPSERQPYVEMIDIAIVHLKDPARASRIFADGMAALKTEHDKEALAVMYHAIRSRLVEGPPQEGKTVMSVHHTDAGK